MRREHAGNREMAARAAAHAGTGRVGVGVCAAAHAGAGRVGVGVQAARPCRHRARRSGRGRMNAALRPCVDRRARVGSGCGRMNAALHPCVDGALPRVRAQDAGMPRSGTPDARATRHARCSTPGHAQGSHSMDRRRLPCDRQRRDRRGAAASHRDVAARALWHGRRSDGDRSIDPAARHRPCSVNDDAGPTHEPTHGRSRRARSNSRTGITTQR